MILTSSTMVESELGWLFWFSADQAAEDDSHATIIAKFKEHTLSISTRLPGQRMGQSQM